MVPASISQAINFLTRPLILTQTPKMINCLKSILRSTLGAQFDPAREARLVLSFSASSLPATPILGACIATGIRWAEWMQLLSNRDFDMIIEARSVFVKYLGAKPQVVLIWADAVPSIQIQQSILTRPALDLPQVPISKLGQQQSAKAVQASLRATVDSALARAQTRTLTLAQQLLQCDEQNEADEIFSMISKSTFQSMIISPTPTRETFDIALPTTTFTPAMTMPTLTTSFTSAFPSPLSSPEALVSASPSTSDSSRPSSRSSNFSTYSFSDDDSATSVSSVESSFDFLASTKPCATVTGSKPISARTPAFVPRRLRSQPQAPQVIVDNTRKEPTKYLYQGGVSTVLTGGVMLGGGKPSTPQPKTTPSTFTTTPKYRAPIGGKKPFTKSSSAADAQSWRRTNTSTSIRI
ncbi:hypothetical protein CPC08DRAFT_707385 [Agrocybe pediades]|nr:hypothetical protein CPC08DRAFT_707385 [Agrocybe pediades]